MDMKNTLRILLSIMVILGMFSCVKEKIAPNISVDKQKIMLDCTGSDQTVNISSNVTWSVYCFEDWISVSTTAGMAGDTKIRISAGANHSGETRQGFVVISGENVETAISVSQSELVFVSDEDPMIAVDCLAQDIAIDVLSNLDYEIDISDSWLTPVESKGAVRYKHMFHISDNTAHEERKATLLFHINDYELRKIEIVQAASPIEPFIIFPGGVEITTSFEACLLTVPVKSNYELIPVLSDVPWAEIKSVQREGFDTQIIVDVKDLSMSENIFDRFNERCCTILFDSGEMPGAYAGKVIQIRQFPEPFSFAGITVPCHMTRTVNLEFGNMPDDGYVVWSENDCQKIEGCLMSHTYEVQDDALIELFERGAASFNFSALNGMTVDLSDF